MFSLPATTPHDLPINLPNHSPTFLLRLRPLPTSAGYLHGRGNPMPVRFSPTCAEPSRCRSSGERPKSMGFVLQLAAPAVFFFVGLGTACASASARAEGSHPPFTTHTSSIVESICLDADGKREVEGVEELDLEFEKWKSKKFALTVPMRVVALRGSFPASWIKDFFMSQSRRARITPEFRASLQSIFSGLVLASKKASVDPKSIMSADIVSIGDSWLSYAVKDCLIEPIYEAKEQKWFDNLSDVWKTLLCRNNSGDLDPHGEIWGVPYRWGSMVIVYKTDKFQRKGLSPIVDWEDLWRPELCGKISMVDCPREVVGAVLKYMGVSYNTKDIDSEVPGGRKAVMQNLELLQGQVKLFDSVHYLKAFTTGDVWVAVGWSSDVLPAAKRMSNVAVVIPKSGSSLWADIWVTPAATRFATEKIGGRVRGPSPLIYQWIDFCLQPARAYPFKQEIIPGSSPSTLGPISNSNRQGMIRENQRKDVNRLSAIPSPEVLARCEFLEPLSEKALVDYQWLVTHLQRPRRWLLGSFQRLLPTIKNLNLDSLKG